MNEHEFESFVITRTPALLRTAYLLCSDQHLAEDLVQTALAKTAQRLRRIREPAALEAYVRRTMYHEQVSRWRRRKVDEELRPGGEDPSAGHRPGPLVADESAAADSRVMIREALRGIAPRQRAVLVLRFFDDLTERETAAALGCSIGTVKSQTRKALQRLVVLSPELGDLVTTPKETRP